MRLYSSDPSSFDIYLVNMNGYPNVNKLVAENVQTSDGSYTLKDLAGVDNGYVDFLTFKAFARFMVTDMCNSSGFQVNFMSNDDKNTGILAQSAQFNVESSDSTSSTTSASSTSTSTSSSSSSLSASSTTTKGKTTTKSCTSSPTTTNTRKHITTSCTRTSSHASSTSPSTTLGESTHFTKEHRYG